ncbi:MAG: hypothetical protein EOM03_04935 [Clostridia bacterium]|nr:hypothetical protein [Clostridia bacterium]
MKKYLTIIVISVAAIVLAACGTTSSDLTMHPGIKAYSPSMSSVPGIELTAVFTRDVKNKNLQYHWVAEQGTFLMWNEANNWQVKDLGQDVLTNVHKVHWSVGLERTIPAKAFQILLSVENTDTGEIIASATLQIEQPRTGYFIID